MANNESTQNKGAAVYATTPKTKTSKPNFTDNSLHNQRLKLINWLLERGSITTKQAQLHLDIYYPPARIKELRRAGYLINTLWDSWTSEHGIKHRIGRYVLTKKQPIETEV